MSDVPSEAHREILLRLPAESLFRFRSVCKSWLRIIDDPSFVRSHTANNHRSSPNLLTRSGTGIFHSFHLDSLNYVNGEQTIHVTHVKNLNRLGVPRIRSLPVASCNGLILISHHRDNKTWVIWNPLTADFHELYEPNIEMFLMGSGIGYDSRSDDYKVVRIGRVYNRGEDLYRTLIYSLKSKSWKMSMNCPLSFVHPRSQGVYVNGAVHWISSFDTIVALDLATEEFRELQTPPSESLPWNMRLDALDGFLVLSDADAMRRAWVMRGYGTEEANWELMFTAKERSVISGYGSLWPLAYLNSERRFLMQCDNRIMRWDIEKCSVKRVTIDDLPGNVTSQIVPGSLFRLNGRGSEKTAGVKRKRSSKSKRLKFTATTIDSGSLTNPLSLEARLAFVSRLYGANCNG